MQKTVKKNRRSRGKSAPPKRQTASCALRAPQPPIFDRFLFVYWDGQRERKADPIAVHRALSCHAKLNLETHLPLLDEGAQAPNALVAEAMGIAIDAAVEVFGITSRWSEDNEQGLTDGEILGILAQFGHFMDGVKKNTEPSPTSSPADADSASTTPPSTPAEPTATNVSSDSGSTSDAKSSGEAGPSSTPSAP